jgi:hypothetical protein
MPCAQNALYRPADLRPDDDTLRDRAGWALRVSALVAILVSGSGCRALREHEPAPRAVAMVTVCSAQDGSQPVVTYKLGEDNSGHPDWLGHLRLHLETADVVLRPGAFPANGTGPVNCRLDVVIEDRPGPSVAEKLIGGFLGGIFKGTFAVVAVPVVAAGGGPDAAEELIGALTESSTGQSVARRVIVRARVTQADGQSADFEDDGEGTAYYDPATSATAQAVTALRDGARTRAREDAVIRAVVGVACDMIRDPRIFGLPRSEVEAPP